MQNVYCTTGTTAACHIVPMLLGGGLWMTPSSTQTCLVVRTSRSAPRLPPPPSIGAIQTRSRLSVSRPWTTSAALACPSFPKRYHPLASKLSTLKRRSLDICRLPHQKLSSQTRFDGGSEVVARRAPKQRCNTCVVYATSVAAERLLVVPRQISVVEIEYVVTSFSHSFSENLVFFWCILSWFLACTANMRNHIYTHILVAHVPYFPLLSYRSSFPFFWRSSMLLSLYHFFCPCASRC